MTTDDHQPEPVGGQGAEDPRQRGWTGLVAEHVVDEHLQRPGDEQPISGPGDHDHDGDRPPAASTAEGIAGLAGNISSHNRRPWGAAVLLAAGRPGQSTSPFVTAGVPPAPTAALRSAASLRACGRVASDDGRRRARPHSYSARTRRNRPAGESDRRAPHAPPLSPPSGDRGQQRHARQAAPRLAATRGQTRKRASCLPCAVFLDEQPEPRARRARRRAPRSPSGRSRRPDSTTAPRERRAASSSLKPLLVRAPTTRSRP